MKMINAKHIFLLYNLFQKHFILVFFLWCYGLILVLVNYNDWFKSLRSMWYVDVPFLHKIQQYFLHHIMNKECALGVFWLFYLFIKGAI